MQYKCGLVSISFRNKTPAEIVEAMERCGLSCIEWGSDVHATADNEKRLLEIAALCRKHHIDISSYGTYFCIGKNRPEELLPYIRAAALLGTDTLRLWCGTKGYEQYTPGEWSALIADCRAVAALAKENRVTVCMECHNNTVTDCLEGSAALLEAVNSEYFRMYWQPNQYRTAEENRQYAAFIAPYTVHIHVFHWHGDKKYPLEDGAAVWKEYLKCFPPETPLLLEFMPDDKIESLKREAATLQKITEGLQ